MVDLFDIIKDLLPYNITFSLSLALVLSLSVVLFARYRKQWLDLFVAENILAMRVFLIVFLLGLPIASFSKNNSLPVTSILVNYWWIILIYCVFEAFFFGYKIYLRKQARVPKQFLAEIYQILTQRQDGNGGFRVDAKQGTPVELWCTAQTFHGFIAGFNDITLISKTSKVLNYYQITGKNGEALWSESQNNFLVAPATWALISLVELLSTEGYAESLSSNDYSQAQEMFSRGLEKLIQLQLSNGGWAPVGKLEDDLRIFPTTMAVWALAVSIRHRRTLMLEGEKLKRTVNSLSAAIELLEKTFDSANSMWDNNPSRSLPRRMSGLTLMVYTALSMADIALLSLKETEQYRLLSRSLHKWLDNIHESVMIHIDYCFHRDTEDAETDGPYDNIIKTNTTFVIPIGFYDWIPASMLAIYASKITGRYTALKDALREKRLTEILVKNYPRLHDWYTYRLAVIVIASSPEKE